jgi:hypothetical protein
MAEPWVPSLHLSERSDRCRLTLSGLTHGDGHTLQQAADDLIARLLDMALYMRSAGYPVSTELPPPDYRLLEFLWELGERAAGGEDIRAHVFGSIGSLDTSV